MSCLSFPGGEKSPAVLCVRYFFITLFEEMPCPLQLCLYKIMAKSLEIQTCTATVGP